MRKLLPFLLVFTLACNATNLLQTPTPVPTPTPAPSPTAAPTPTASPSIANAKRDLYIESADIIFHPDQTLYAGDLVSIEAIIHDGANKGLQNFTVELYVNNKKISSQRAFLNGLGRRLQATFEWAWDTTGHDGEQLVTVVLDPDDKIKAGDEDPTNNEASVKVNLRSRLEIPTAELETKWLKTEIECCVINYMANTPAARDLEKIKAIVNDEVAFAEKKLGRDHKNKITFNFINRVMGHGGFASESITITYMDRDYAAGSFNTVVRHETTHILARQLGKARPTIIEEGFATYIAGGHFKFEPFAPRVAALVTNKQYIPLAQLADNFYPAQHEIGYLEGASFIEFLVDKYGWNDFLNLLNTFQNARNDSVALDNALRAIYKRSLTELEADYLIYLRAFNDPRWTRDIENTVRYYDTVRLYQKKFDPSTIYLNAWIPDIDRAVRDNLVPDYYRHPNSAANIALETLLIEADKNLDNGNFDAAERYLNSVNKVLAADGNFTVDPLATDYSNLVNVILKAGYDPQRITVNNNTATALVTKNSVNLIQLQLVKANNVWSVKN